MWTDPVFWTVVVASVANYVLGYYLGNRNGYREGLVRGWQVRDWYAPVEDVRSGIERGNADQTT